MSVKGLLNQVFHSNLILLEIAQAPTGLVANEISKFSKSFYI